LFISKYQKDCVPAWPKLRNCGAGGVGGPIKPHPTPDATACSPSYSSPTVIKVSPQRKNTEILKNHVCPKEHCAPASRTQLFVSKHPVSNSDVTLRKVTLLAAASQFVSGLAGFCKLPETTYCGNRHTNQICLGRKLPHSSDSSTTAGDSQQHQAVTAIRARISPVTKQ
jgi:hypothetical protein